jgi:very-short-patch-repair endonuclease
MTNNPLGLEEFYGRNDHEPTIENISIYYEKFRERIIEYGHRRPLSYMWDYPFDWHKILTPIEYDAWQIIRSLGYVVLYPQYPVLNYRADFANPNKKIILECDGKAYHDKARDTQRDIKLFRAGWKVFRVTGSELYRNIEIKWDDYTGECDYDSLQDHYLNTAEGVIKAIRSVYFTKYSFDAGDDVPGLEIKTLEKHRLINFPIENI